MTKDNSLLPIEILILESNCTLGESLSIALPDMPYNFKKVHSAEEMFSALELQDYAVILINAGDDCQQILKLIRTIRRKSSETVVIVLANPLNRSIAADAINAGAADCLFTPVADSILLSKIISACEMVKTRHELFMLRQQVAMNYAFDNLVGVSPEIQKVKRTIQHSVGDHTAVILSGEEGTGTNLVARIIHYHSSHRHDQFVPIDCSTDTAQNALAELAENKSVKGTVFIDKLHLADKTTLLNLQKSIANGLTGNGPNFRLIFQINEPLYNLYAKGVIDRKLFEGLNAIEISLPALRERTEDIEPLVFYFLRMISFNNNTPTTSLTPSALTALKSHHWPGNVSELNSCLRRAAAVCTNNCIDVTELQLATSGSTTFRESAVIGASSKSGSLEENQRRLITNALNANEWNFSQTAIQLGIGRTTLWRKVRKFNLKRGAEVVSDFEPAI